MSNENSEEQVVENLGIRETKRHILLCCDQSKPKCCDKDASLESWNYLKKRLKEAEAALDAHAYAQYPELTESEIKTLVVDDKWLAAIDAAIQGDMDRVSQRLTQRVKELAERYETPLPQLASRVTELEATVNRHLEKMGFAWK